MTHENVLTMIQVMNQAYILNQTIQRIMKKFTMMKVKRVVSNPLILIRKKKKISLMMILQVSPTSIIGK